MIEETCLQHKHVGPTNPVPVYRPFSFYFTRVATAFSVPGCIKFNQYNNTISKSNFQTRQKGNQNLKSSDLSPKFIIWLTIIFTPDTPTKQYKFHWFKKWIPTYCQQFFKRWFIVIRWICAGTILFCAEEKGGHLFWFEHEFNVNTHESVLAGLGYWRPEGGRVVRFPQDKRQTGRTFPRKLLDLVLSNWFV